METKTEQKAIIDYIKDYFKKCPYLSELAQIKVDYLDIDSKDCEYWSLEPLEVPLIIKKNVIGTKTTRQCQFILASRFFINPITDTQNINNLLVFENIAEWIYSMNKNRTLPKLNDNELSTSLEVMTPGRLYGVNKDGSIARYQMQCKLIYEKKEG